VWSSIASHPKPDESVISAMLEPFGQELREKRSKANWLLEARHLAPGGDGIVGDLDLWKRATPSGELKETYWFLSSPTEDLVISCNPFFDRCEGAVEFKDLHLEATLIFSKSAVPQHQIIVDGPRILLKRWQPKAGATR
jgi:hypothetical protein